MKFSVDDVELFTLSDTQKNVLKNEIMADTLDDDLKRRAQYIITHKYDQCFKRLKAEWDVKLAALGVQTIPTDPDEYAELVFARPEYKDRTAREAEVQEPPE